MLGKRIVVAMALVSAAVVGLLAAPRAAAATSGTVIAVLPQAAGFHGAAASSIVEYWTTGPDGSPAPASGVMYEPAGAPPPGGWPVAVYLHGTAGLGKGCSPQSNPAEYVTEWGERMEDGSVGYLVDHGFVVVAPDFLGLGRFDTGPHPYLHIDTEVTATTDFLRAVHSLRDDLSPRWFALGTSQGGQVALAAGHQTRSRVPELEYRGSVAVDPASGLEHVLPLLGPGIPIVPDLELGAGFVMTFLAGLRAARPDSEVDSYLTTRGRILLDDIAGDCITTIAEKTARAAGAGELFARPLGSEPLRAILTEYTEVPTSGYTAPILLMINTRDTVVPAPLHALLAADLTAHQTDVEVVVGHDLHCVISAEMNIAYVGFLARVRS
ncbi:alpha/beta hydrolase family protein [Nocardia sp. NPDC127579]|uniref:alpha/beta hydrolase family protein n=1 Tax=Nocardia sp. NPDC127579 TaxID=3345402 RepID=UPI003642C607